MLRQAYKFGILFFIHISEDDANEYILSTINSFFLFFNFFLFKKQEQQFLRTVQIFNIKVSSFFH